MQNHFILKNRHFIPALVILFSGLFVVLLSRFLHLVIDDAYITFQYAKNFSEHLKPWYNLDSEFQGNGQTSLLWLWILSSLNFFNFKPEHSFYFINIILGFYLIHQLINQSVFNKKNSVSIVFNFVLYAFFTYWLAANSSHGLETILSAFVLYFFIKNWNLSNNLYVILLPLVRPEFAVFGVFWILDSSFFSKDFLKKTKLFLFGIFVFLGYYFIFFDYYLPLSFVLKSGYFFSLATAKVFVGYLILFSPVLYNFFKKKELNQGIAFMFILVYYTFFVGSYSSTLYIRYLFPLMVFFFFLKANRSFFLQFLMIISALRMVDLSTNFYQDKKIIEKDNSGFEKGYGAIVKILNKNDKILIIDAGYTAYFSSATCYDGYGLNDATLVKAWKNKDSKKYKNYVDKKGINYVAISSKTKEFYTPEDQLRNFIYHSLDLKNKKTQKVYPFYDGAYLFLFQY